MNYSNLNATQKRCIDAFIGIRPELASATKISRGEVEELFKILFDKRDSGGQKIGYPMWLIKGQKVGRGEYVFPAPNVTNKPEETQDKQHDSEEVEFYAELRANGINV